MVKSKDDRPQITAGELMAQLEQDEDFQRRKAQRDAERAERTRSLIEAQKPILEDLARVGITVGSVWDFVNMTGPYPDALPVLFEHLKRGGYPDRVMEGLGRSLGMRDMNPHWDELSDLYRSARSPGEETGLAIALAASAEPKDLEKLMGLLRDDSIGDTRIFFVRPIIRFGGRGAKDALAELRDDPVVGREIRDKLKLKLK